MLENQLAGTGAAADAYFNNIAITPEPATMVLLAVSALLLLVGIRRTRRV